MSDTATIAEVSPRETVTWTMPRATYDLVSQILQTWPLIHGRRPRATVERALILLERALPDVRTGITHERRDNPSPQIRGHKSGRVHSRGLGVPQMDGGVGRGRRSYRRERSYWPVRRPPHSENAMTTRRAFLASLAITGVAPTVLANALAAPTAADTHRQAIAIWARQCGWKRNPAWVMYDLLARQYGASALDRESFERLAEFCDETVPIDTPRQPREGEG